MSHILSYLSLYALLVTVMLWAITGILFFRKNRTVPGFFVAAGSVSLMSAHFIPIFISFVRRVFDVSMTPLLSDWIGTLYHIARMLTPLGFFLCSLGLLLVLGRKRK